MSLADQLWCPTSVQVTVLQARGLRIKGKSGTNDAYAVMQVGKEKYQTSVVEKSVAPVWKEEAAFDLPQLQQGGGGGGSERSTLHVHVLHRALVGPDKLLGQAVINLRQLSEDTTRNKTEWFKLLDKTGKADKDRGEVLVDIQFMRNNMTASMFDLSAAGKSRSRLGKFKDKVRGKKKESDTVSSVVPSFSQVLTDSEEEGNGDAEVSAGKDEKKKKHKMKSLFSPKSNLQKNMSQSMSVLPAKNSSLSGSQSSGLNVDSSEGKKKFKFLIHKRSGSSDSKDSSSGQQKHGAAEQSNLCINGSHVYCEEPQTRTSRIGSSFSLASSGHGSMEDVPESSPPSVDSLRAVRQYSPWTEEEEETADTQNIKDVGELEKEDEERIRMEEERRKTEEEEEMLRKQEEEVERLAEEKRKERMRIEEEEKRQREEEERIRMEEERAQEERRRQEEERKLAEDKRRLEEERRIEDEKVRKEEEERIRREEEERAKEERRRQEEELERLAEEKRREEEEERRRIEEEEMIRMEEERAQEERRRQEEEERARRQEEERKLAEEKRKLEEEEERRRTEEEKARKEEEERIRKEQERAEEERRRQEEEEMVRRQQEEHEEKQRLEEQERRRKNEEERIRKEEEEKARRQEEEYERQLKEEERKKIEAEEKIRKEEEERLRMEEERRRKEEEEANIRRQEEEREKLAEEKRIQEEQERRRIEEEEKREREEKEKIRKEEERRREEEEERARKEKEEYERILEEKMRQEEQERRRIEEEERIRQEELERIRMEKEKKRQEEEEQRIFEEEERIRREEKAEEEARKLETRNAEEQKLKENKTKHKAAGTKPKAESPAEVASTNPFDEDFTNNPFEEGPDSPAGPDEGSTVKQRSQSAVSLLGSKTAPNDEKDLISTQREKRQAPQPPGRNQAQRQGEQEGSAHNLAQINKQNKDKDIKTASVLPQRSVQMIAPLSRSPTDATTPSLTQSSATKSTTNVAKHSKRPAPARPQSVEEGPSSELKTASSSNDKISDECGSEAKQEPIVYGLNPFEEDEDENELPAQDDTTNTGSVKWSPAVSQAADKDATSQAKIKSSKMARAPPLPVKKTAASSTLNSQNIEGGHVTDNTGVTVPDNGATHPSDLETVKETPVQKSQPEVVQSAGGETGGKKEGPPVASRRLLPVKPLNPLGQQSISVVQGERDNKSSDVQEKTKVKDSGMKGPYSQLTREELISLVLKQENQLSERDVKISELELYIDNLLVRVIEEMPSILMSMNSLKKPV